MAFDDCSSALFVDLFFLVVFAVGFADFVLIPAIMH